MTELSDFHEQLHNNFTKGTFVGFVGFWEEIIPTPSR